MNKFLKQHGPPLFVAGLIAAALAAVFTPVLFKAGETSGKDDLLRLNSIFGDVLSMPESDRALLATSAIRCGLFSVPRDSAHENAPTERAAILACLREGAAKAGPTHAQRLEELIDAHRPPDRQQPAGLS